MDTVEAESHLEAPTQHVAGHLAGPGASVAAEAKVLINSGPGITATSKELVEALLKQPGMTQTALTQAFAGHVRVVALSSQEWDGVQYCHAIVSTPLNNQNTRGASQTYDGVYRAPWERRCGYHRAEDAEIETQHRRHGAA